MNKKLLFLLLIFYLAAPYVSFAARANGIPFWGNPLLSCVGDYGEGQDFVGPHQVGKCLNFCDILDTVINIIYFGMTIAIFILSPILFAWGGIMILTAGANPGNIESGKKILTGTLIGVVIVLASFLIIKTIVTFVGVSTPSGPGLPGFTSALNCNVQ